MKLRPEIAKRFDSSLESAYLAIEGLRANLRIPDPIDIVDWIEKNVCVPSTVSTVGGTLIELYGYQRGIARLAVHPDTKWLIVPKATRTGLTQLFVAINAYHVFYEGKPCGIWQPTDQKAEKFAKEYWHSTVKESPELAKAVRRVSKGDIQDTWYYSLYRNGGKMIISSAMSDENFRGDTLAKTSGDEVDGRGWWGGRKDNQGKKFLDLYERSKTFWDRAQYLWSSPLEEGTSNIWREWLQSDQRRYMVRCPHCKLVQYLKWGGAKTDYGIKWSVDERGVVDHAWYVCEHSGCIIEEPEKFAMDEDAGQAVYDDGDDTPPEERLGWQPTKIPLTPGHVGCHVPGYISLFAGAGWKALAQEWLNAQGDAEALQTFVNNALGEPWRALEVSKAIDVGSFEHQRPIPFDYEVPSWVLWLTAYIDVQEGWADESKGLRPRYEVQVVGWGPGYEAAMIGHFVLQDHGIFTPESLEQLDDIVFRDWKTGDGRQLRIAIAGIDASHRQNEVLAVCREAHRQQVFRPMKGESEVAREKAPIIVNAPKPNENKNVLIRVGTRRAKDFADRMLRNETPGHHHLHIPRSIGAAVDSDEDGRAPFYKQLFAEKKVIDHGIEKWVRRGTGAADTGEVWDCLVGNIAAIELAMLTYPEPIGREVGDLSPHPPRERYDGEDRSAMAMILATKLVKSFQGDTRTSVAPQPAAPSSVSDPSESNGVVRRRFSWKDRGRDGRMREQGGYEPAAPPQLSVPMDEAPEEEAAGRRRITLRYSRL